MLGCTLQGLDSSLVLWCVCWERHIVCSGWGQSWLWSQVSLPRL